MHSLITQTVHMCTKRPLVSTADYIITLLPPGTQQHEGRAAGWLALHCGHWKLHCAHCGGGGTDPRAGIQKQSSLYNTLIIFTLVFCVFCVLVCHWKTRFPSGLNKSCICLIFCHQPSHSSPSVLPVGGVCPLRLSPGRCVLYLLDHGSLLHLYGSR